MPPVYSRRAMEVRLVIFLAFTSVVLTGNALVIWFVYKAFANITTSITGNIKDFQTSGETRNWLHALESASFQAVTMTDSAKKQVAGFDATLARVQSMVGFGLAKIDVKIERACVVLTTQTAKAQEALVQPAEKIGAAIAGFQNVLEISEILGLAGADADATPKQKR